MEQNKKNNNNNHYPRTTLNHKLDSEFKLPGSPHNFPTISILTKSDVITKWKKLDVIESANKAADEENSTRMEKYAALTMSLPKDQDFAQIGFRIDTTSVEDTSSNTNKDYLRFPDHQMEIYSMKDGAWIGGFSVQGKRIMDVVRTNNRDKYITLGCRELDRSKRRAYRFRIAVVNGRVELENEGSNTTTFHLRHHYSRLPFIASCPYITTNDIILHSRGLIGTKLIDDDVEYGGTTRQNLKPVSFTYNKLCKTVIWNVIIIMDYYGDELDEEKKKENARQWDEEVKEVCRHIAEKEFVRITSMTVCDDVDEEEKKEGEKENVELANTTVCD